MAPPRCLPDLLRARSTEDPERVALRVDGGDTLSYRAWEHRSNAAARALVAGGVAVGDRVALVFENERWTDFAVAYLAVHKAGAVAVPLGRRFAEAELARVLAHCQPSVVIGAPHAAPPVSAGLTARIEELEGEGELTPFQAPVGPHDMAEILYTSGTTGAPKGVACPHGSIVFHDLPGEATDRPPTSVVMAHAFPIGTNAGQECLRMPLRQTGNTAVVVPRFDPERLCAAVERHRVNRLQLVPAMAQMIVTSGAVERHDVSSVERVILSSAPTPPSLPPRLAAAFPNASVWNAYALTESGSARTLMRHDERRPGSVGRPVGKSEVRIVDERGRDLPAEEAGEVWLRREGTPRRGYYQDPASTAAAYVGDWLRTGDLGYLDDDGFLYLVDRQKDVIISGGFNVASLEVENALYEHSAVVEAAVFGISHQVLGQQVAAAVVLSSPVSVRDLQSFVRSRLGEHKVPRHVFVLEALPRNASGKVLKNELRDRCELAASRAEGVGPRDELEAAIAAIWREVLAIEHFGVHDDFFDLGGHSLSATAVLARLQDIFHVTLPVTAVFERPTVAELAEAVQAARAGASR